VHILDNHYKSGHSDGQSQDIDYGRSVVPDQITEGNQEVVSKHAYSLDEYVGFEAFF
jgi:hypothetical protein